MKQTIIILNASQVTTKNNEAKTIVNYVVLNETSTSNMKGYPLNQKWLDGHIISEIDSTIMMKPMEVPLKNETNARGNVYAVIDNFEDLLKEETAKMYRVQ